MRTSHVDATPSHAAEAMLESAPTRSTEVRLAYAGADAYRPYDVARASGDRRREDVPLATLARLEQTGDLHGVAAGLVLSGDDARAEEFLARAPASVDVDADRAAVLLDRGQTQAALEALDAVLARKPDHAQALFNRALALRNLDVPLAAAEAFARVADLHEKGWEQEARAQAESLRASFERRQSAWAAGSAAGMAMARGGPPVGDDVVSATPDLARGFLYQALRTATTKERVLELAPLANRLDGRMGGHLLADLVDRVSRADFGKRAPLAQTYTKLLASDDALGAQTAAYLVALRAAGANDMLLGAIQFTGKLEDDIDEYERLATASGDPWFSAIAAHTRASARLAHGDVTRAEQTLRHALAACVPAHVEWRCAVLEQDLEALLADEVRTTEARTVALSGLSRAQAYAHYLEPVFISRLADIARYEGRSSLLAAYAREVELEAPDDCPLMRMTRLELADARAAALDVAGLVRELAETPRCGEPLSLLAADEMVDAIRLGGKPEGAQTLPDDIAAMRDKLSPDRRARADTILARLLYVTDPVAGERMAHQALDEARSLSARDPLERKAETYVRRTLAIGSASSGQADEALMQIAAGARSGDDPPAPGPCSLGVATDNDRVLVVTRDASGATTSELVRRSGGALVPSQVVPAAVSGRLASCPAIHVYALPPVQGTPDLLPPNVAWSYSSGIPSSALTGATRRVVVSDVAPPADLGLPRLGSWGPPPEGTTWVHGPDATPGVVLSQMADATEVEIDAHGIVDPAMSAAAVIALSPDAEGRFALSASDLTPGSLRQHPVVVLGACHAAKTATYFHQAWSLPTAFLRAGARAVFASPDVVRDAEARPFFDGLLARIRAGTAPAVALRDERASWVARDPKGWVSSVMLFE